MRRRQHGDLVYYTFDLLEQDAITHAISTRHGGISPAPFHTLNLSSLVGDAAENPQKNLHRLYGALELDASASVDASQAQADQIARVDAGDRGTRIENVDALITNAPALPLLLRYADCVPILFYDPTRRAIGVAHAGWRGTVAKIAAKTVRAMRDAFGTQPKDLRACIGPSIGPCCYQVGDEVIARVRAAFGRSDNLLVQQNGTPHLDLWQANARQLQDIGVEQIEIAAICTADYSEEFYSWRAQKKNTGRFGAVIALAE